MDAHFVTQECPPLKILKDAQVFRPERNQFVRRGEEKTSESDAAVLSSPSLALSAPEEVKADAGIVYTESKINQVFRGLLKN